MLVKSEFDSILYILFFLFRACRVDEVNLGRGNILYHLNSTLVETVIYLKTMLKIMKINIVFGKLEVKNDKLLF